MAITASSTYGTGSPPTLRGYLHLASAMVAPYALLVSIFIADSPREVVGGAAFGANLITLCSTSATYHLVPLGRRLQNLMRRIDHSMIFVFIAGAHTTFALKIMGNA